MPPLHQLAIDAEASLRAGHPEEALGLLQSAIRAQPGDARLRIFLFQLLAVLGQWERALKQLEVATELDASTLAMAQMYREAVRCEMLRSAVFDGSRVPLLFGEPEQWLALLIEAQLLASRGDHGAAQELRESAFEQAPASSGQIDGQRFAWLADADPRLGPVCEAVINGCYYWIPFARLSRVDIEPPSDLRDCVWAPAHFLFANGGEAVGIIPSRYPGSETSADASIRLGRRTEWLEHAGCHNGLGQRLLITDGDEYPLLEVRSIQFDADNQTEMADG